MTKVPTESEGLRAPAGQVRPGERRRVAAPAAAVFRLLAVTDREAVAPQAGDEPTAVGPTAVGFRGAEVLQEGGDPSEARAAAVRDRSAEPVRAGDQRAVELRPALVDGQARFRGLSETSQLAIRSTAAAWFIRSIGIRSRQKTLESGAPFRVAQRPQGIGERWMVSMTMPSRRALFSSSMRSFGAHNNPVARLAKPMSKRG